MCKLSSGFLDPEPVNKIQYDEQGRIISFNYMDQLRYDVIYTSEKVSIVCETGAVHSIFLLNPKGLAYKKYRVGAMNDTMYMEYDENGYLISKRHGNSKWIYTIKDANRISEGDPNNPQITYEYYDKDEDTRVTDALPFWGKISRSRMKSKTIKGSSSSRYEYVYHESSYGNTVQVDYKVITEFGQSGSYHRYNWDCY